MPPAEPPPDPRPAAASPLWDTPHLPHRFGVTPIEELAELLGIHIEAAFGLEQPIDLLGCSLGGVIRRSWIQLLGGHRRTRRLITVGSPQQGTLTAQPWPSWPWPASPTSRRGAPFWNASIPISTPSGTSTAAASTDSRT